jgi:hypothetical protein
LVPLTVTSIVQSIQYLTSILTTTVTSYTSTSTSTNTIPTVTTVVLVPYSVTSTEQSTQYLTSILTTTVTSYTSTTTSTSTSVVYTTVTVSPGGAGAVASSPLAYLGLVSLLAVTVGRRATAGKGRRIRHVTSHRGLLIASSLRSLSPHFVNRRDTILSRPMSLMEGRCSSN